MKRLLVAWVLLCAAMAAHADGGRLLLRQAAGPFIVSLFSQPESIGIGDVDLSAMVEEKASGTVLLNPEIVITLTPPAGGTPIVARLSHTQTTSRVLQDAVIHLPSPGCWQASIAVTDSEREGHVSFNLVVADHSARRSTIWIFALMPVVVILLFAWVQYAKRPRRHNTARPTQSVL